jgi:2-polyprenyl-6-methoxyphenol hydroxylase-like FAD-dependent oxidoreductase
MQGRSAYQEDVDVLIAGGGVAGAAAAAALSQLGLRILIIEPGPAQDRRLAGELIHPPGIEGLCRLGLLSDRAMPGSPVKGFAIFPADKDVPSSSVILCYGERPGIRCLGRAIEHRILKSHLLETVQRFPGVTARIGARITRIDGNPEGPLTAVVQCNDAEMRIRPRLMLGADGPMSRVRKMIGISHETRRYSGMMGVEVEDTYLPNNGYGNIFLTSAGVAYAYAIGNGRARIMFEVLKGADSKESIKTHLGLFPPSFRRDIERVLAQTKPLAAANFCIVPNASVRGNAALVGDARGCCHPLTASGITAAVKDALILRDALAETDLDIVAALRRYARRCGRLELTRRTLAEELREAFLAQTPEALLLRECIFSYWRTSAKARVRSMALLSTVDTSIFSLASQYGTVALQAFRLLPLWFLERTVADWHRGVIRLVHKSLAFQYAAIRQWLY